MRDFILVNGLGEFLRSVGDLFFAGYLGVDSGTLGAGVMVFVIGTLFVGLKGGKRHVN